MLRYLMARTELSVLSLMVMIFSPIVVIPVLTEGNYFDPPHLKHAVLLGFWSGVTGLVIADYYGRKHHQYVVLGVWYVPFVVLLLRAIGAWTGVRQARFGWWAEWWSSR